MALFDLPAQIFDCRPYQTLQSISIAKPSVHLRRFISLLPSVSGLCPSSSLTLLSLLLGTISYQIMIWAFSLHGATRPQSFHASKRPLQAWPCRYRKAIRSRAWPSQWQLFPMCLNRGSRIIAASDYDPRVVRGPRDLVLDSPARSRILGGVCLAM